MGRYKILIVDDEPEILESLRKRVAWNKYGFELVGSAGNGIEAWNIIESDIPDLIITDIKMPYMDGLQLAGMIRKKYDDMKIVIFSGFNDFQYAKEAIKYKVEDYIMKPVNSTELEDILKKIKDRIDYERNLIHNVLKLREKYCGTVSIVREKVLNRLVRKEVTEELYTDLREYVPILFEGNSVYNCAVINCEGKTEDARDENIWDYLVSYIEESFKTRLNSVTFKSGDDLAVIFIDEEIEKILNIFSNFIRRIRNSFSVEIYAGLGTNTEEIGDLKVSYTEALRALKYARERKGANFIFYHDIDMMVHGNCASVVAAAKNYIREHYMDTELTVESVADIIGFSHSYFSSVYKRETGEACSNYINKTRLEMARVRLEQTEDKTYIIAEKTGFSDVSYFSYAFKKYFGISPIKYRKNFLENKEK